LDDEKSREEIPAFVLTSETTKNISDDQNVRIIYGMAKKIFSVCESEI
jgi:hypothetical protein